MYHTSIYELHPSKYYLYHTHIIPITSFCSIYQAT